MKKSNLIKLISKKVMTTANDDFEPVLRLTIDVNVEKCREYSFGEKKVFEQINDEIQKIICE